jgi:hypothetical protein
MAIGNILGYFLFKQIYYIVTYKSSFKTWFVVGFLWFQKLFDTDVLGFQIELCCRCFGLLLTWRLLGDIFCKFGQFFSNLLVTLGLGINV